MANARRTTDTGTVILHALLAMSVIVLTATGLRIATDDPDTPWLAALDPVLPTHHLWFYHVVSGLVLGASLAGYARYIARARLTSRVRLDRARMIAMLRPGRARWSAINVVVFWGLMAALTIEIATGMLLFAGAGGAILSLHRDTTFVLLGCIVAHVALHAAYGGLSQVLCVFRPAALVVAPPPPDLADLLAQELAKRPQPNAPPDTARATEATTDATAGKVAHGASGPSAPRTVTLQAHPLASAVAVMFAVCGLAIGAEQASRPTLHVLGIQAAEVPVLDGDISDPVWVRAKPSTVLTTQGGDFGGTHQSTVEIRAVHDGIYAYFAFVWDDPTRSLKHMPLVKRGGRWFIAASRDDLADEARFNEDKLAVLLTNPGLALIGSAIHLARQPISDKPPSSTGRGLHYIVGDGIADVWQWRASHAGVVGHIDNSHFGQPSAHDDQPGEPAYQYGGGYSVDPGPQAHQSNIVHGRDPTGAPTLLPRRLPRDAASIGAALGRLSAGHGESDSEGARWWMSMSETVPYSAALDAAIPDGAVLPSILVPDRIDLTSASIRGTARWAAGRWTLELVRRLYTGSAQDIAIKSGVLMWVAAFDHAEKRHTRHLRPFRLEVD